MKKYSRLVSASLFLFSAISFSAGADKSLEKAGALLKSRLEYNIEIFNADQEKKLSELQLDKAKADYEKTKLTPVSNNEESVIEVKSNVESNAENELFDEVKKPPAKPKKTSFIPPPLIKILNKEAHFMVSGVSTTVSVGQSLDGFKVKKITLDSVVLTKNNKKYILTVGR
jgi:preprotein translocase subunit SecF